MAAVPVPHLHNAYHIGNNVLHFTKVFKHNINIKAAAICLLIAQGTLSLHNISPLTNGLTQTKNLSSQEEELSNRVVIIDLSPLHLKAADSLDWSCRWFGAQQMMKRFTVTLTDESSSQENIVLHWLAPTRRLRSFNKKGIWLTSAAVAYYSCNTSSILPSW